MTVSMRVLSAGDGYRYLLKSVAVGDGNRSLAEPLTRYYAEKGTPPGYWLGSGVASLGAGGIAVGDSVTETQLELLLGLGCDPTTGEPLGRAWPVYRTVAERVADRVATIDPELHAEAWAARIAQIEAEERARPARRAVAGFDLTFSVPKSVSVLWSVADVRTQSAIVQAHHRAVAEVLDLLERDVAVTRVGADAGDGSVAQMEVSGAIATAYDHYDSRSGDPQLHTHVVVANKARAVHDGRWRTLDGRPLHAAVVALSEHYNAVLADHLTGALGVEWQKRDRGERRSPAFEIVGVPDELIAVFSSRSRDIDLETDRLITAWRTAHSRDPSTTTILKLRQQATLATRPPKELHSLAELTAGWRERASSTLSLDSTAWARALVADAHPEPPLRAQDVPLTRVHELADAVVREVEQGRSVWRHWNLYAEAARQLAEIRFASTVDREAVIGLVVDAAEHASVRLTPPELAASPIGLRRPDGTSRLRPRHGDWFTSSRVLEAEDLLLGLAHRGDGPTVGPALIAGALDRPVRGGFRLTADQADAVTKVAGSGRVVDVLVGPAGAGKTTALRGLRRAWEAEHGAQSVVGLAPSAAAAEVLAEDLGIGTENTAKWLYEHPASGWRLHRGQLLIIDEASLAGTLALGAIAAHAEQVGAKLLLVGDPAQLSAVDAGGGFGLLVRDLEDPPRLRELHRFKEPWEADASLRLRDGDASVLEDYANRGRIVDGEQETVVDAAYRAWQRDVGAGRRSLLIADSTETVLALNERARLDRMIAGHVAHAGAVVLHDRSRASRGDLVISRSNNRWLRAGTGWVRNGDRWTVQATHPDGSVTVSRQAPRRGSLWLPADYVAESLELGYAVSVHRGQGTTVDTAHSVIAAPTTAREALYVAMTRGRRSNTVYVATDRPTDEQHQQDGDVTSGVDVLARVLARKAGDPSARELLAAEQERWSSIAQLAAEYLTIAATAGGDADTGGGAGRLIAGLIPIASGTFPADVATALQKRAALIEGRAAAIADAALAGGEPWVRALGPTPSDPQRRPAWLRHVRTVAAYRDRYRMEGDLPLGQAPSDPRQDEDRARAEVAVREANRIASPAPARPRSPSRRSGPTL